MNELSDVCGMQHNFKFLVKIQYKYEAHSHVCADAAGDKEAEMPSKKGHFGEGK